MLEFNLKYRPRKHDKKVMKLLKEGPANILYIASMLELNPQIVRSTLKHLEFYNKVSKDLKGRVFIWRLEE